MKKRILHLFHIKALDENGDACVLDACVLEMGAYEFQAVDGQGQPVGANFGGGDPNEVYPVRSHIWSAVSDHLDYCQQTSYTVFSVEIVQAGPANC